MAGLTDKKCVPCEGGVEPFRQEEAKEYMEQVEGWELENGLIYKDYEFENFEKALDFVNEVGELAEEEGHHPDIYIHGFNKVKISLATHAIGGLSENDFIMAAKIDNL